jgi:tripeptide aminopeptidase
MGLANARQDENGIVLATVPGNLGHATPVVAFNAHLDTSPETSAADARPQVMEKYSGGDIRLAGDPSKIISAATCPELNQVIGHTLVTTDGKTLLGADDKAGVAIIMEIAQHLLEHPEIPHGDVRVVFTCDEEIGRGTQKCPPSLIAADVCYTFDGGGRDIIDHETFSADLAVVTLKGVNIHPSIGKGRMVNAVRAAGHLLERLPRALAPEQTEGREGFLHPYTIDGGVALTTIRILIRDFDSARLADHATVIHAAAKQTEAAFPGLSANVEIRRQYRNMAEGLAKEPRAVRYAVEAHRRLGRGPRLEIIRGGTDGSQFTEQGLPTPNLSSGQHNIHSPLEWASLDEMQAAVEVGVEIVRRWGEEK